MVYKMCIKNVARTIRKQSTSDIVSGNSINVFQASEILAIAFCKSKEEVIDDLIKYEE
jgi:hypothetical protein